MISVKLLSVTGRCYDIRRSNGNLLGHFVLNTERSSYVFISEPEVYITESEMVRLSERLSAMNLIHKQERNKC